jgi:hypothetical protein
MTRAESGRRAWSGLRDPENGPRAPASSKPGNVVFIGESAEVQTHLPHVARSKEFSLLFSPVR